MKKFFFIAVAMFAVASVFTSCSKDGSGSSYNPDLEPNASFLHNAVTPEQNAQKADSMMQQWAQHLHQGQE